ncbi:ABC transporter ATP-binding protein [Mangrovibacter plantisponsor]|uniref:ABC-type Fe3+/spermidine/putrescine transport system ATPase subunit n=1 Tax=Mangrovibacter plantisponsor TaxID=451513 RepID=A0A317Q948_9ENTR|nr:ABC transporter ATP-binding protein [Mangrovibacter plantisponsor]PWW12887.1 ABC-type Fe3+/spermidine/putrescine transport system ATPase subunit [Mangrovibacter plantisponsor]
MSYLQISQLTSGYGKQVILRDIDLSVNKGEMLALLGPSGCGKTTLLNTLCGFIPTLSGEVSVAGRNITLLPAEQRNITMVFQSYALWPHLTVAQNIGFGLKVRKVSKAESQRRIMDLLAMVNLEGMADKNVAALSGGQRQRVALARALAIEPDVLVLDEPLSNLDAKVRLSVRHEIKTLQEKLGFTSLIVTHDQEEALVMADRIAVMNQGTIEQLDTPENVYQHPATAFVADFMGADNRLVWLSAQLPDCIRPQPESWESEIYFRSTDVAITREHTEHASPGLRLHGVVEQSAFLGHNYRHGVRVNNQMLFADAPNCWAQQTPVTLHIPAPALHIFARAM